MATEQDVIKANLEFHEKTADTYDKTAEMRFNRNFENRMDATFRSLFKRSPGKLLEVGCGTGTIMELAQPYFDVHGVDLSPKMVAKARKRFKNVRVSQAEELPYKDNTFDVVVLYSFLHHVYDLGKVLFEAKRVLKPGGILYIDNDPNKDFFKLWSWWIIIHRRYLSKQKEEGELENLRKRAEFRADEGINGGILNHNLNSVFYMSSKITYRYPDNPDLFTKIIKCLFFIPKRYRCYHYIIEARK
jgi:ubiquinone/menaquinone biosynthesis C-methylase UbiE